jgi:hypothetical protein
MCVVWVRIRDLDLDMGLNFDEELLRSRLSQQLKKFGFEDKIRTKRYSAQNQGNGTNKYFVVHHVCGSGTVKKAPRKNLGK